MTKTWMNKERMAGLLRVWNWLPAFRVVAETEHLPTAADLLGVSPSALSRTVAALETELGRELFRRVGRRIELNASGEALLLATRDAMRRAHDGVTATTGLSSAGPLYVSATYVSMSPWVVAACESVALANPGLVPIVREVGAHDALTELIEGGLDVSFQTEPLVDRRMLCEHLADLATSVWCGPRHPLYGRSDVTAEQVQCAPFVIASGDGRRTIHDGWPASLERRVGLVLPSMGEGAAAAASGPLLVVLPDALAVRAQSGLRRVPFEGIPTMPLYAVRRRPLAGTIDLASHLVDGVIALLREDDAELVQLRFEVEDRS